MSTIDEIDFKDFITKIVEETFTFEYFFCRKYFLIKEDLAYNPYKDTDKTSRLNNADLNRSVLIILKYLHLKFYYMKIINLKNSIYGILLYKDETLSVYLSVGTFLAHT